MKKLLIILLFVFIASVSFAQVSDTTEQKTTATIYFMRATNYAMSVKTFSAFINDELVCKLDDHKYSMHEVKPGKHLFSVQAGGTKNRQKKQQIQMNVEAGKSYYFESQVEPAIVAVSPFIPTNNVFIQEITESAAKRLMDKYKMKPQKTCLP